MRLKNFYKTFKQMKMNKLTTLLILSTLTLIVLSCTTSAKKKEAKECCTAEANTTAETCCTKDTQIDTSQLSVLYFHATRRCATCEAVEKVTKATIKELYSDTIPFHSINREKQTELAQQFKVEWQTLMIVKGDQIVNLTNEAFLNARTKPEKLKALINSTIESML